MTDAANPLLDGGIHDSNPFVTPPELRDPVRQLRGRMPAPVTILTAGEGPNRTGLTVSSLVVAEGDPPLTYFLLGPSTDLADTIADTGRFVVHVCDTTHRTLADIFAGVRPAPGGMFHGLDIQETPHGPRIAGFSTVAFCTYLSDREESYSSLVTARIDSVETGDLADPLLYFRGAYRKLDR